MNIKLENWLNKHLRIIPPLGWVGKREAEKLLDKLIEPPEEPLPPCSCYDCNKKELQEIPKTGSRNT